MANQMIFKTFTSKRLQNMRQCDGKNYKFSADWSQPQPRNICAAALKSVSEKLALIAKQPAWGTKEDTPSLVAELAALLPTAQLGSDDMQNAFTAYQAERYFLRIWWRGTAEERDKLVPKAPAKKAAAKKAAAPKAAPKKASTKKPPVVKATPTDTPVEPEVIDINAPDKNTAALLDSLCLWLQNELSAEQKHDLVVAMVSALAASEKLN